jgi:hypothetical protein
VTFLTPAADAMVVRLNKDTEITVKFDSDQKVSSGKLSKGDSVDIVLAEPIVMDDSTIVESGASGKAVVTEMEKAGKAGKPGYIKVQFATLLSKGAFATSDDEPILLTGEVENQGSSKKLCSYIMLFGLIIKGGQGEIDTSATYTATIKESIKLKSN